MAPQSPGGPPYPLVALTAGYRRWRPRRLGFGDQAGGRRRLLARPATVFAGVELETLTALRTYFLACAIHGRPRGFALMRPRRALNKQLEICARLSKSD